MSQFTFAKGKTALITGGAFGIGFAVAQKCIQHGMKTIVADNNAQLLRKAGDALGEGASVHQMDVGKADDWAKLSASISKTFEGQLDFLFLNAGIQPSSSWDDMASFQKIFETNFFGVTYGINTFLDTLKKRPGSAIVITGSKQGITNPPGNPAYNASKSAVKTIAEHLSYDLRDTRTQVHMLVPGWTFTGLGRSQAQVDGEKPAPAWTATQVADYMEEKMALGQFYILCPDNEVTEEMDKKRILWGAQDLIERRPPLSRWRSEFKAEYQRWSS